LNHIRRCERRKDCAHEQYRTRNVTVQAMAAHRIEQTARCHPEKQHGTKAGVRPERKVQKAGGRSDGDRQSPPEADAQGLARPNRSALPRWSSAACSVRASHGLYRRTRHIAVGAEHAAIACLWLEQRPASLAVAVVEEQAGIGRHRLAGAMPAIGTGDRGLKTYHASMASRMESIQTLVPISPSL